MKMTAMIDDCCCRSRSRRRNGEVLVMAWSSQFQKQLAISGSLREYEACSPVSRVGSFKKCDVTQIQNRK